MHTVRLQRLILPSQKGERKKAASVRTAAADTIENCGTGSVRRDHYRGPFKLRSRNHDSLLSFGAYAVEFNGLRYVRSFNSETYLCSFAVPPVESILANKRTEIAPQTRCSGLTTFGGVGQDPISHQRACVESIQQ